jgi:hypothetical protein
VPVPFRGFQRYSFTPRSIRQNAPQSSGVYGISNAKEWVFIGSSEDLQASLVDHLESVGSTLMARTPTGFIFEPCPVGACVARRDRLIAELKPVCNRP